MVIHALCFHMHLMAICTQNDFFSVFRILLIIIIIIYFFGHHLCVRSNKPSRPRQQGDAWTHSPEGGSPGRVRTSYDDTDDFLGMRDDGPLLIEDDDDNDDNVEEVSVHVPGSGFGGGGGGGGGAGSNPGSAVPLPRGVLVHQNSPRRQQLKGKTTSFSVGAAAAATTGGSSTTGTAGGPAPTAASASAPAGSIIGSNHDFSGGNSPFDFPDHVLLFAPPATTAVVAGGHFAPVSTSGGGTSGASTAAAAAGTSSDAVPNGPASPNSLESARRRSAAPSAGATNKMKQSNSWLRQTLFSGFVAGSTGDFQETGNENPTAAAPPPSFRDNGLSASNGAVVQIQPGSSRGPSKNKAVGAGAAGGFGGGESDPLKVGIAESSVCTASAATKDNVGGGVGGSGTNSKAGTTVHITVAQQPAAASGSVDQKEAFIGTIGTHGHNQLPRPHHATGKHNNKIVV
jgi:hypothetical protein